MSVDKLIFTDTESSSVSDSPNPLRADETGRNPS